MKQSTAILDGFEFVPAVDAPALTLDKYYRLYINRSTRRLLGVSPYDRLAVAYRPDRSEIAIVKSNAKLGGQLQAEALASVFAVDKRYYLHLRVMDRLYAIKPAKFVYDRGASDGTIFVFRRQDSP